MSLTEPSVKLYQLFMIVAPSSSFDVKVGKLSRHSAFGDDSVALKASICPALGQQSVLLGWQYSLAETKAMPKRR